MRSFFVFLVVVLLVFGCTPGADEQQVISTQAETQFKQIPQIQQVKPEKPVKIKLRRNAKGDYTWEIRGDNVDKVIKADKQLRKLLKVE
ncbi:MAG TPA: hypothetical protein DEP99_06345 [Nitrospiraceae bacterium]|nr:hypothetical protein [Nitrospiraceae bacterium]